MSCNVNRRNGRAWPVVVVLSVALLVGLVVTSAARAELPGTIGLSAAGDGHLWWIVRVEGEPERQASGPGPKRVSFALMHHAAADSYASERLVTRFPSEPVALAAEGQRVVVVSRDAETERIFIVSMLAVRNEATGGWFTLPTGLPELFKAPPEHGEVRGAALASGRLGLLLRLKRAAPTDADRHWFGSLPCEGAASGSWTELAPPELDLAERVHLVGDAAGFHVVGSLSGKPAVAREEKDGWRVREIAREAPPLAARGIDGAFAVAGRIAVVERSERVRLGLLRDGVLQPWAEFEAPERAWALGPLSSGAALIELGPRERAVIREIGFADGAPRDPVSLEPPSIAMHRWIHLPILAVLSVTMVLAAVIFGSDAYLQSRNPIQAARRAPGAGGVRMFRGAGLGRRASAMLIDTLPGMILVWLFMGGTPFDLLRYPTLQPDLAEHLSPALVLLAGWLVATIGDVFFGRSMGKRMMSLRIVSTMGSEASAARRLMRSLCALVTVLSPVVMLLAYLHPHGDGPAEMLTGTVVVSDGDHEAASRPDPGSNGPD